MSKLGSFGQASSFSVGAAKQAGQKASIMFTPEHRSGDATKFRVSTAAPILAIGGNGNAFSHSINQELHAYALGNKIRRLRLRKGMPLVNLGKVSGLSSSMLCKLERGRALPTLPTLLRISHGLGVELDYFFHDFHQPSVSVVRRKERLRFRDVPNSAYSFAFESLNFRAKHKQFNAFWAEFQPASDKPHSHQHKGVEFLYMLEGDLAIRIGPEEHQLETGDAIYFESGVPHSYRSSGANPCRALVVVSVPDDEGEFRIDASGGHHPVLA